MKAKMGRPKKEIDLRQIEQFCLIQCTLGEIAMFFDVSEDTIERRIKESYHITFAEFFKKKRVGGLMSLRRNLFKLSENSPQMAIFLAKNWLHMKDAQEVMVSGDRNNVSNLSDEDLEAVIKGRRGNGTS